MNVKDDNTRTAYEKNLIRMIADLSSQVALLTAMCEQAEQHQSQPTPEEKED